MKHRRKGKRLFLLFLALLLCLPLLAAPAHAVDSVGYIEDFQTLDGELRFIGDQYRSNYYLDIERTGLLEAGDKIVNDIANVLFAIIRFFGELVVSIFYFAMDFDVAVLFSGQIDNIQAALKASVFDTLLMLAIAVSLITLIRQLARLNVTGMASHVAQIVIVIVLSSVVVTHSSTALSFATTITKEVSVNALMSINERENTSVRSYAANTSAAIWNSLIHEPWLTLEFSGTSPSAEDVERFLTTPPGTPERETLVSDYMDANSGTGVFGKHHGGERLGFLFVYLFLFLAKSIVYLFAALIQLGYQVMAVFYVILAPLVLLLSLFPSMGGLQMVGSWLKKILETQIMILMITFILGLLLSLDSLLYSLAPQLGWLVVLLLEAVISAFVMLNHKSIFKGISRINRAVQNPRLAQRQFRYAGNLVETVGKGNKTLQRNARDIERIGGSVAGAVAQIPSSFNRSVERHRAASEPEQQTTAPTETTPEQAASGAQRRGAAPSTPAPAASQQRKTRVTPPRPTTTQRSRAGAEEQGVAPTGAAATPPQAQTLPKWFGREEMVIEPVIPPRPTATPNVVTERFLPQAEQKPPAQDAPQRPPRPVTSKAPSTPVGERPPAKRTAAPATKTTPPAVAGERVTPPPKSAPPAAARGQATPPPKAAPQAQPAAASRSAAPATEKPQPASAPPRPKRPTTKPLASRPATTTELPRPQIQGPEIDLKRGWPWSRKSKDGEGG